MLTFWLILLAIIALALVGAIIHQFHEDRHPMDDYQWPWGKDLLGGGKRIKWW